VREWLSAVGLRLARPIYQLPEWVITGLFGSPPENDRGQTLDYQLHLLTEFQEQFGPGSFDELGVDRARRLTERTMPVLDIEAAGNCTVRERTIEASGGTLPVRIYRSEPEETRPGCVFYHGGGFVIGSLNTHDGFCRFLSEKTGFHVVSVDYRLAPEHPFPAAVEDGLTAFRWVRENIDSLKIDPNRLAVAGDSAGATIATVVAQQEILKDGQPPDYQLLIYPMADATGAYASRSFFDEGYFLTESMVDWFSDQYLSGADVETLRNPRLSPIHFDRLGELPPALVVTVGFDPLRDEGEAYAKALKKEGVPVVHRHYEELLHGFVTMGAVSDAAAHATTEIAEEFRKELDRDGG
jgi:acetyl esterase